MSGGDRRDPLITDLGACRVDCGNGLQSGAWSLPSWCCCSHPYLNMAQPGRCCRAQGRAGRLTEGRGLRQSRGGYRATFGDIVTMMIRQWARTCWRKLVIFSAKRASSTENSWTGTCIRQCLSRLPSWRGTVGVADRTVGQPQRLGSRCYQRSGRFSCSCRSANVPVPFRTHFAFAISHSARPITPN